MANEIDGLKIVEESDIQTINLDLNSPMATNNDSLGIELLADPKKSVKVDGYSSGEEKVPSPKKEDFNLFSNNNINDLKIDDPIVDFGKEKEKTEENIKSIGLSETIKDDPILSQENKSNSEGEFKPIHMLSPQEIKNEKIDLIYKFKRLENQGIRTTMNYNMNSGLDDMRNEYIKLKKQRETENSIKFQRKMLMACITGVEYLNGKFDPFDVNLEGWSESIMENISDYDEVFEELHDKYGESVKMAPELKLISMVAGSGFMFHLTNSLFKSATPDLKDILKQNPDIMKNISEAAAKNMNQNIDDRFGSGDSIGNMMKSGINNKVSSMNYNQPTMSGPKGIDDLIGELNDDNDSVSSEESINMTSSSKKAKRNKKGGISLNI